MKMTRNENEDETKYRQPISTGASSSTHTQNRSAEAAAIRSWAAITPQQPMTSAHAPSQTDHAVYTQSVFEFGGCCQSTGQDVVDVLRGVGAVSPRLRVLYKPGRSRVARPESSKGVVGGAGVCHALRRASGRATP